MAQTDTIVVTYYTKVMVSTDESSRTIPVTTLEGISHAGFFLNEIPNGSIRICSENELFVWTNGMLLDVLNECKFFDPNTFFSVAKSDTVFISFSSQSTLEDLNCDLIVFEELQVIKDQVSLPRKVRSEFEEFTMISLLVLILILGFVIAEYPSRISYLLEKSFTLKASAYEFVNTNFYTGASIYLLAFYSLALAFVGVYLDALLDFKLFEQPESLVEFIFNWFKISGAIFGLFIIKWLVISIIARLFRFRDLENFQLFDFLNFNLVLLIPALLFIIFDFVINDKSQSWISSGFMMLFPAMLILFVVWFTLKFVNNSSRKKLSIISYLCATEIIPVIILLGWFLK